jgi:hypothetical protein
MVPRETLDGRYCVYCARGVAPTAVEVAQLISDSHGLRRQSMVFLLESVRTMAEVYRGSMARSSFTLVMLAIAGGHRFFLRSVRSIRSLTLP